jgi:beta-N-acetylhexosaminidase
MKSHDEAINPGQLLIVGFDGTEMTTRLFNLLARVQPAGVILFARNIRDSQQTWQLLKDCQRCVKTPLFTCVDLEGGSVDRFREVLAPAPSAAEVFSTGDRKLFRRHGKLIGESCRTLGFNVNFAPVLDLAFEASKNVMSSRSVSGDPRKTVVYAREFLAGLRLARVLGCGKHFPGLGEGKLDSHQKLPVIDKTLKKLWAEDLLPYRSLRTELPMVMISHAAYPPVTRDQTPASLSKIWITEILQKRVGYRKLIVSDDLEMGAIQSAYGADEAAVEHIRAGGDLSLICHREERVEKAYEKLAATTQRDSRFAKRAADSVHRVLAFKKKSAALLRSGNLPSAPAIEKLSRNLWEFGEQVRLQALTRSGEALPRA